MSNEIRGAAGAIKTNVILIVVVAVLGIGPRGFAR
jgi:hypothetical protein